MKLRILFSLTLSLLTPPVTAAQPTISNPWVGLWQPAVEDPPGVLLTLGDDDGRLAGAIVFNIVVHDGGQTHIAGHDAHTLLNLRIDGDMLRFQVIRRTDNLKLEMTAHMTADGKATLHCGNCGPDAPRIDITRER